MNNIVKQIFLVMIACCFLIANVSGQIKATAVVGSEDKKSDAPEMTFEKLEHDFGKVALNDTAVYEFKFTNTGSRPIIVQRCSVGCGCTVSICPDHNDQILPGQSRVIKMQYTRTNYEHRIDQSATIVSSAHNSPIRIRIVGEVAKNDQTANN